MRGVGRAGLMALTLALVGACHPGQDAASAEEAAQAAQAAPALDAASGAMAAAVDEAATAARRAARARALAGEVVGAGREAATAGVAVDLRPPLRAPTRWGAERALSGSEREASAERRRATVEALFAEAGVGFAPRQLVLRVFKDEGTLEVWASDARRGALTLVARYGVCAASGELGPKRQEGDLQVPEGFYTLDLLYNRSAFHLSMRVDYPNRSDRVLGRRPLGGAIMIHGSCVSIGCLAMSDERIEELWVMVRGLEARGGTAQVYIFPSRDLEALIEASDDPARRRFWGQLAEGHRRFEATREALEVRVDRRTGDYSFGP